jgi:hypothetical protein
MSNVLLYGFLGVCLVVVMWPNAAGAERFLRRWGIADPDTRQAAEAKKYMRDRRLLYPPLFLLAPAVAASATGIVRLFVPLIVALLVAEVIAALRPVRGRRIATLTRRHWRDLVPRWAVGTLLGLAALAALMSVAGLLAQPWADRVAAAIPPGGVWRSADGVMLTVSAQYQAEISRSVSLLALVAVVASLVAVLGVVRLAVRRGSVTDPKVDAVLRTRSARVAVGMGIAWMGSLVVLANNQLTFLRSIDLPMPGLPPAPSWLDATAPGDFLGLLVIFVAAAGWIWAANPSNRMPYVSAVQ